MSGNKDLILLLQNNPYYVQELKKDPDLLNIFIETAPNMMKVGVFIASHIYYNGQLDYLEKCINSILDQSVVPDILVSISFGTKEYNNLFFSKIYTEYSSKVKFIFSKGQLFQMEHLHLLTKLYADKYHLIMFCDDDDTYKSNRVYEFTNFYIHSLIKSDIKLFGVKECHSYNSNSDRNVISHRVVEYWNYGLIPEILIDFFNKFKNDMILLKHKFADVYLRNYLSLIKKFNGLKIGFSAMIITDKDPLYKYNINNNNSICYKIEHKIIPKLECIKDTLLLCIIHQDIEKFNKYIKSAKISEKDIKIFCPNKDYIRNFCKKLYNN
jgi:hypothetical protein